MAPAGRLAAGRPVSRHSFAGEHGQEVAQKVNVLHGSLRCYILRRSGWALNFRRNFGCGLGSRLGRARFGIDVSQ